VASELYHHGDLKEALVDQAVRILDAESLNDLSLRRLARDVGVSHAAPYHHFKDLDALMATVAARGFQLLREAMSGKGSETEQDDFHRLQLAGKAYVSFAVLHPELFRLMFGGRLRDTTGYPELQREERLALEVLEGLISGATGVRKAAPRVSSAARASWALVHGIAMLVVDGRIALPPEKELKESVEELTQDAMLVLGTGLKSL
jgi:AcrR family transcriptional regulator